MTRQTQGMKENKQKVDAKNRGGNAASKATGKNMNSSRDQEKLHDMKKKAEKPNEAAR